MSETFQVAHIRQQGQQVILVLVNSSFARMSSTDKQQTYAQIQQCASAAGLAGTVALVWQNGARIDSYGPDQWQGFLRSLTPALVRANINRRLTCG